MEKLSGLLHEETIVNVRIIYHVMLRYKLFLVMALGLFVSIFCYNFYTQPIVYSLTVPIRVVVSHKVSTDLSSLLPVENTSVVNLEELNITLSNLSFLKNLASLVVQDKNFDKLNLGNLKSRKALLGSELKRICSKNDNCLTEKLTHLLKEFFMVEAGVIENRFKLTVSSIEKNTAKALATSLLKAIEEDRVRIRQFTVLKEIGSVGNLIEESRSMMQKMGGYQLLEEQEKLQNDMIDLKEKIRMLQYNAGLEGTNTAALEAKLAENKKATRRDYNKKDNVEQFVKNQSRINEIKINLSTLTHIPEDKRSRSDKLVIAQLISERSKILKSLPAEGKVKSMEFAEDFKEKQRQNLGSYEFDYIVSKNKISKLTEDYEAARVELSTLLQKKIGNENKISGMKADLDFLKGLEAKQMSLKLLNATMTSDLIFEDGNQQAEEFKKFSVYKIFLFSFFVTGFLYLLSILVKYSTDDKIYDEEDIRLYFKELDFVGEVPAFD